MNSNADENKLVALAKDGSSEALAELIGRYSKAIFKKANSFCSLSGIENEDLYQEGMLGFLNAVKTYDEARGVKFSAYALTLASRGILSAVKKANGKGNIPLRSYTSLDGEKQLYSLAPTPEETLLYSEELNAVSSFVENNLSKTEKKVFKLSVLGMSYNEIAEILECSEKSVDNAVQRIRRKLRNIK